MPVRLARVSTTVLQAAEASPLPTCMQMSHEKRDSASAGQWWGSSQPLFKESSLPNGQEWLRRWDQMQTNYLPDEAALQQAGFHEVGVI